MHNCWLSYFYAGDKRSDPWIFAKKNLWVPIFDIHIYIYIYLFIFVFFWTVSKEQIESIFSLDRLSLLTPPFNELDPNVYDLTCNVHSHNLQFVVITERFMHIHSYPTKCRVSDRLSLDVRNTVACKKNSKVPRKYNVSKTSFDRNEKETNIAKCRLR